MYVLTRFVLLAVISVVVLCSEVSHSKSTETEHADGAAEESTKQSSSASASITEPTADTVRCSTCFNAIDRIWVMGNRLRKKCEGAPDSRSECDGDQVRHSVIRTIVKHVCDVLPRVFSPSLSPNGVSHTLQPLKNGESNSQQVSHEIKSSCQKWLHERHSEEKIANLMSANLDAGRTTEDILPFLRRRFCHPACHKGHRAPKNHPNMQSIFPEYYENLPKSTPKPSKEKKDEL